MQCKKCVNVHKDPITGNMQCRDCGAVIQESQIVDDLEFDENQNVVGTFVGNNKFAFYARGNNALNQMVDSGQRNLTETYKLMDKYSNILIISDDVRDKAKSLYFTASNKKFTQGRKKELIVGALLYLACRINETKHLLIDFSFALKINLFKIGLIYIKLVKILEVKVPLIDPSIFMHRYIVKFNFGNKAREVEEVAQKIFQCMDRDWITCGRRPVGICGACILISAKLHNLNIDINNISKVVHVCPKTIFNRIEEFSLTRIASMTKEEFEIFKISDFYPGADPPAFLKARKMEEVKKEENEIKIEEKIENGQKIIENGNNIISNYDSFSFKQPSLGLSKNNSFKNDLNLKPTNSQLSSFSFRQNNTSKNKNPNSEPLNLKQTDNDLNLRNTQSEPFTFRPSDSGISKKRDNKNILSLRPSNSGMNKSRKMSELKYEQSNADEQLSIIPTNEAYKYIYSDHEYGVRKQFWEIMFKDWIEQQKEKEEKGLKPIKVKEPRKRNVVKTNENPKSAYESIKSSKVLSKKVNYSRIKAMLSK